MITLLDGVGYAAIGAFGCFVIYRVIAGHKAMKKRQAELEARREEQAKRYEACMGHRPNRPRHTGGTSGRRTVRGPSMEEQVLNSMMMEDREHRPSKKSLDCDDSSRYSSGASYGSSYSSFGGSSDSSSSSCSSTSSASCD